MPRPLTDDEAAIAEANLGLAYRYAKLMRKRYVHLTEDELVSAALVGLCRAAAAFDPELGKFSTIAWHFMRSETQVYLREAQFIWTPAYTYFTRLRQSTPAALCASHARSMRAMARHSIDGSQDVEAVVPREIDAETEHRSNQVYRAMELLNPRHREVFRRTVIDRETLRAVACDIGVTKERVRQIKLEAIDELRSLMGVTQIINNNQELT